MTTAMGILSGIVVISLIASFLSRKVALTKLLIGWSVGISLSFAFLVFGPERHFANVDPKDYPAMRELWVNGNVATTRLAALEKKISSQVRSVYGSYNPYGEVEEKSDKKAAIEAIKSYAPKMLGIEASYCKLVGDKTSGYLVPKRSASGVLSYYNRSRGYPTNIQSDEAEDLPKTGPDFPYARVNLKYVDSPEDALSAWRAYGLGMTEFESAAIQQASFIRDGERISKMSRLQLALANLLPMAGGTLIYGLMLSAICLLAARLPNSMVRSSFRRIVA